MKFIAFGSFILGAFPLAFCAKTFRQLPELASGQLVTVDMYKSLLKVFEILVFGAMLPIAVWLLFVSIAMWIYSRKSVGNV